MLIGETKSNQPQSNQIKCWFLGRGENRQSTQTKALRAEQRTNKLNPLVMLSPHQWKASALALHHPCSPKEGSHGHLLQSPLKSIVVKSWQKPWVWHEREISTSLGTVKIFSVQYVSQFCYILAVFDASMSCNDLKIMILV